MDWRKFYAGVVAGVMVCEICGGLFTHENEHKPHIEPRNSSENEPNMFLCGLTLTVATSGSNFSISGFPEVGYFTKKN